MNREEAIKYIKSRCIGSSEERDGTQWSEAMWMAIEALSEETPINTPTDLISRHDAIDVVGYEIDDGYNAIVDGIKELPTRITEYTTFCGVPIEEATRIVQEYKEDPLCALADRTCPFQGKEFAWCLTCPHISEEDRELVKKAVEGSEPKTGEWIDRCREHEDYECSECGGVTEKFGGKYLYDYCPFCGAKMRGEEE